MEREEQGQGGSEEERREGKGVSKQRKREGVLIVIISFMNEAKLPGYRRPAVHVCTDMQYQIKFLYKCNLYTQDVLTFV